MRIFRRALLLPAAALLAACGPDSEPDPGPYATGDYPQYEEFLAAIADDAGAEALNCGSVERDLPRRELNCCLHQRYYARGAGYAVYGNSSIDSFSVTGVVLRADGQVRLHHYDFSHPSFPPQIATTDCAAALPNSLACTLNGPYTEPFLCAGSS